MPKYDEEYFIKKFRAIPAKLWCEMYLSLYKNGRMCYCALGHCGVYTLADIPEEAKVLCAILKRNPVDVGRLNDGKVRRFKKGGPKTRIIAALRQIQAQTKSEKE